MSRSRKDMAMMGVIGGLMAFAVFNFAFKPQSKDLSAVRSDMHSVEKEIAVVQAELQAPVETTPSNAVSALAPNAIPEDPAVTALLRQLNALADASHVSIVTITPSDVENNPNGPGGSLALQITASGEHAANAAFVTGLKDLERLLVVEKISVVTPPPVAGQASPPEQLQLGVRVFTLLAPVQSEPTTPITPTTAP